MLVNFLFWLQFVFVLVIATFAYASWVGAPWVPSRRRDVARIMKLAGISPGQKFYDLGCGDGRLVRAAAKAGANAVGFEISLLPYFMAKIHLGRRVKFTNFWNVNLGDADVVFFFLTPKILEKMKTKLRQELKPGAKVIAYVWPFPDWQPKEVSESPGFPKIYLYQKEPV